MVARATVEGFCQFERATPDRLRNSVRGYRLYDLDAYWGSLQPSFHGMAIFLRDEEWLSPLLQANLGPNRESWIVLDTDARARAVLSTLKLSAAGVGSTATSSRSIPVTLRFEILRRDNFTCGYCGRRPPDAVLHVDHVVPWSKGGTNDPANLRTACQDCNLGKRDRRLDAVLSSAVGLPKKL